MDQREVKQSEVVSRGAEPGAQLAREVLNVCLRTNPKRVVIWWYIFLAIYTIVIQ